MSIKFSHEDYAKFFLARSFVENGDACYLVGLQEAYLSELPDVFKEWDTRYYQGTEEFHYPLSGLGKYLVLFYFDVPKEKLFCTIRRSTLEKKIYYESKLFKRDVIEIQKKEALE